jgi:uncharacterized membrane protein YfcA
MNAAEAAALAASGFGAGVMNALAGGGTILTFPSLLLLGMDARVANGTSTMGLVPGAATSLWVHRREVAEHREWVRPFPLLVPSVVGGAAGAALLVWTEEKLFAGLAPWLVLFATVMFLLQAVLGRRGNGADAGPPRPARLVVASLWQFAVAVYGGYFGAAIGILMLAVLGFLGLRDMHAMNGLKNFLGMCINGVACVGFAVAGLVDWPSALVLMAASGAGGFAGARFSRVIGRDKARWAVVAVGFLVTGLLLAKR